LLSPKYKLKEFWIAAFAGMTTWSTETLSVAFDTRLRMPCRRMRAIARCRGGEHVTIETSS